MYARKRLLLLFASLLSSAMLWGCGSNGSGGSDVVVPSPENVQTLGIDNCFVCHGVSVGEVWTDGVHGNKEAAPSSPLPDNPNDPVVCSACHDQLGDGARLAAVGQTNRPVVGCESCHGGGSAHRGVGLIPYPNPDRERCGQCHNASYVHSAEGDNIVEDFRLSPHANSLENEAIFVAGTTDVRALCSKCHTDEGAKLYRDVDGNFAALTAALPNTAPALNNASSIECRTCHQAHNEGALLESATPAGFNLSARSAEFNTCTNCHQLFEAGSDTPIIAYHDPAANPFGNLDEIITDTHLATPGNFVNGTNVADITGYAFDYGDERACRNCHNPHSADTAINEQWAESRHADKTAAGAWAHYNWTEIPGAARNDGTVVGATGDRRPCQRCHTTSGVVTYLDANADGDPSDYVAPLAYDANFKPEMLKCNGCHVNNVGGLRSTGQITADYTNAPTQYPQASGSNICISCHSGRESGDSIKNSTANFADTGFINSHYLTAGGTVFAQTGFTYGGRDYSIPSSDRHDKIGMGVATGDANFDAVRNNYTNGPCVSCHFGSNDGSHTLSPLTQYAVGDVSLNPVCIYCHTNRGAGSNAETTWLGTDEIAATLQGTTHKARYQAALEALKVQLALQDFNFTTAYPYFANRNWITVADPTGKLNMGAAFNYNLMIHDPGGVAHNRRYTRRLIYDSIDHLDDGVLNYSVAGTLNGLPDDTVYKASAIAYLLRASNGDAGDRY